MLHAIAVLALLVLTGCSSTPTRFYMLTSVPAASVIPGPPLTPPIEVGQISLPDILDRDSIVVRGVGDQLDVMGEQVWGGPIDEMIRGTLSTDLTARLPPGSVLPPGDPGTKAGVRVLVVNIQRFGGDTSGRVVLAAEWTVFRNDALTAPPPRPVSIEMKAASGTVADIVPVMSRAMGALADRIAQGLGE
ncbi:MAG TPA: PqiC family protein [Acetobacteraceae bacterium]|nr:PqiC family protein [Acetobacteraceae bacterium]